MRKRYKVIAISLLCSIFIYVCSYIALSSRGVSHAKQHDFPTFYYVAYSINQSPTVDLSTHYFLSGFYYPLEEIESVFVKSMKPTGRLKGFSLKQSSESEK